MRFSYYNRLTPRDQATYRKSDAIATVPIPRGAPLDSVISEIAASLARESQVRAQNACQMLANELARRFAVPPVRVSVLAIRPVLRGGDDLYGLYEPADWGRPTTVSVWMRTSQRRKVVAFRTFLRTFVHEFCHHLDYELFGLAQTFHTAGFYKRESNLTRQLLERVDREY